MDRDLRLIDFEIEINKAIENNNELLEPQLFQKNITPSKNYNPKIWAITSGKGGSGKTLTATSQAITLSKMGYITVILDFDLNGANVNTFLGAAPAKANIRHYFDGTRSLEEICLETPFARLFYVQGFWDSWTPVELSKEHVPDLIKQIRSLKADYVILDIGTANSEFNHDLFSAADERILVTTPEVTSIEKTYRFLETDICLSIKKNISNESFENLISTLRHHRQRSLSEAFSFRTYFKNNPVIDINYFEAFTKKPIRLIINQSRSQSHEQLGHSIKSVCNKYYDLGLDFLGTFDYDNAVWQSLSSRQHILQAQPFSPLAGQFLTTCKQLIDPEELRAVI